MVTRKYSRAEKAAILLMGLGEEIAAEIFKNLSETEMKNIATAMRNLGRVDQDVFEEIIKEFHTIVADGKPVLTGGRDLAQRLVGKALHGDEVLRLAGLMAGTTRVEAVDLVDSETLANLIQNEHPQTVAILLASCDPAKGGEVLVTLPEALRGEVLQRLANLRPVTPELLEELDQHLRQEIENMGARGGKKLGGLKVAAQILNTMGPDASDKISRQIGEHKPDLEEAIRAQMFVFEDLAGLEPRALQELIKNVPANKWLLALRNASTAVKDQVLANMSPRAANLLREDMLAMPRSKLSDVEAAQREILKIARNLEEAGKISLSKKKEQYV